jgi:hypothetical protein
MATYTLDELRGMEHIDTRDLIETANELRGYQLIADEDRELIEAIDELADQGIEDWHYGSHLIREDQFKDYAQELAEDIGAIGPDAQWPVYCIDWDRAAQELAMDYTSVDFLGWSYYVR